jgi:hypothetical protein
MVSPVAPRPTAAPTCAPSAPSPNTPSTPGSVTFGRSRVDQNAKALNNGLTEGLAASQGDRDKLAAGINKLIDFAAPLLKRLGVDDAKIQSFKDGVGSMIRGASVTQFALGSLQSAQAAVPPKLEQTKVALERLASKYQVSGDTQTAERLRAALQFQFQPAQ